MLTFDEFLNSAYTSFAVITYGSKRTTRIVFDQQTEIFLVVNSSGKVYYSVVIGSSERLFELYEYVSAVAYLYTEFYIEECV